jgi:predicted SprT family Zn-dependent metalloprotease
MAISGTARRRLEARLRVLWRVRLAGITVVANPRLRTTPARFRPATARLEISPSAVTRDLRRVLVHELAHAAAVEPHGRRVRPHGKEWRALVEAAERAGLVPKARPNGAAPSPRKPSGARYAHTCPVCHFSRTAKRKVTTWRCPECRANDLPGVLTIERRR